MDRDCDGDSSSVCDMQASARIVGVAFGAEDFTNDMGIERTESETETYFARNSIAVAARAADVLALDTPYFTFRDS